MASALVEKNIAHRAFFDCGQLIHLIKMEEEATWRGPYAERNTFDLCAKFHAPEWLNLLPPDGVDSQTFACVLLELTRMPGKRTASRDRQETG